MADPATRAFQRLTRSVDELSGTLANELAQLGAGIELVSRRQQSLESDVHALDADVQSLAAQFHAFVQQQQRAQQVQLAETRLVKARQQLERDFGFHAEVRRRATGLLQALDAGVVSHRTIRHVTEDVMTSTPGYWLAPALVAVAAWIRDDRPLAERARDEALRRDDVKASLFFALVLRRYRREEASIRWLTRYFQRLDPTALRRPFVVLLDAVATGAFGPGARARTAELVDGWLERFAQQPDFAAEQERRWLAAIAALEQPVDPGRYPMLRAHSPTWQDLEASLKGAAVHAALRDQLTALFTGELPPPAGLEQQIDGILRSLVTRFDDAELPLRREERLLALIVELDGDRGAAEARLDAEQDSFEEETGFPALLTGAAMHPDNLGVSVGTQRYATALSRQWLLAAHDTFTARLRADLPQEVELEVDGWDGRARDGSEGDRLAADLRAEFDRRERAAADAVELSTPARLAPFAGAGLVVVGLVSGFEAVWILAGLAAVAFFLVRRQQADRQRVRETGQVRQRRDAALEVLDACLAEVVDLRAAWQEADAVAEETRQTIAAISPAQHTLDGSGASRSVIA